ncbi:MgtC/SapB family protein [Tautonia sp. JC769]|uniref:MgtC/SapB family protein n=1 Tax=Tautonia sp. JC769 TaxID=3232135 RepID=UPI0034578E58
MIDAFRHLLLDAIGRDLAEFGDLAGLLRALIRLSLAALLGGIIGLERSIHARPAGLRTFMLVAVGSAAFVLVSEQLGIREGDLSRVIQGLLTGVGFLGAGVIFRSGEATRTRGITTAAGIWLTASLGMAVGLGRPATAVLIALLTFVILSRAGRSLELFVTRRARRRPPESSGP